MDERTANSVNNPVNNEQSTAPVMEPGDVRRTDSGLDQQGQQQQMNSAAQQQATQDANRRKPGQTIMVGGQEVPFYPAPRGHATETMYRLNQRAREQERTAAKVDLPASATPEALASARVAPMPAGGLHALAAQLYPDDVDNQDAMDGHVFDLLTLNRDTLRDDTSHIVGQIVRVPA